MRISFNRLKITKKRLVNAFIFIVIFLLLGFLFINFYATPVTKNVDSYIYDLPYLKGTKHRVVQGYGGLFSHSSIAALDFEMPVGTPVCAAREGVIYSYKDDSNEGGISSSNKNKANYIIVKHKDGSFGCYWHLKQNGVLVKKGFVSKGQQIGLSGATGLAIRPHLHFSVKRILNYEMNSFLKTRFETEKGVEFLENRREY